MNTTTRNATLTDLMGMLTEQHTRKLDVVTPATSIRSREGVLTVTGSEAVLTADGVTTADGSYVPTSVCDEGIADKLAIPVGYLKRTRTERPDLYDANVNGFLHGRRPLTRVRQDAHDMAVSSLEVIREGSPADLRSFLLRCFRDDQGGVGIARAFLSDRFSIVDNIDVLMSALDGVRQAGVQVDIKGGDLTDRRMVVRIACPEVTAMAPTLLKGYRSPFTGALGDDNPLVFAGFRLTNSETGGGAFSIAPEITVQVCNNGLTMTKDAMRAVHLGGKLETGLIHWAADTQSKALELVQARTRDAVATFLNPTYLADAVARLEARAGEEVATVDAVRDITKPLGYSQEQIDGILGMFVKGGQMNRAGVVNAITAYSQEVIDGDAAHDLDSRATSLLV